MSRNISAIKSKLYGLYGKGMLAGCGAAGLVFVSLFSPFTVLAEEASNKPSAVVWYEELAAQGNVDAKYNLGMMNETGWSVPVDLEKAVRWYRDAAKEGHAEAQLRLGMLYYLGMGSRQSQLKGASWIRKSANQGNEFAESLNRQLFADDADAIDSERVLRDARKVYLDNESNAIPALKRLVRLAKQETRVLEREKEKTTIRERREERKEQKVQVVAATTETKKAEKPLVKKPAVKKPKQKIEKIESVVPEFVGQDSVEENRTLAKGNIETIRMQAKKGQASAQYNLGRMYDVGIKLPVDKKEALIWYEKAASQGYPDAEYRMAIALLYGINIDKDETMGRQWLSSAANHGHKVAANLLQKISGDVGLFKSGQSIVVDWYLERAIVGDADAAFSLGKIYEFGWGAIPDAGEAGKWYQKAISLGSKEAHLAMQKLTVKLTQQGGVLEQQKPGLITQTSLPSNWIAYLIAILVAAFIFFSPAFVRKTRQKSEFQMMDKDLQQREEPPFN